MSLARRLPKRGFTNIFSKEVQIVNVSTVDKLNLKKVDIDILYDKGIINKKSVMIEFSQDTTYTNKDFIENK